ncbi:hypothetical protein IEQ34_026675 [Dendrobium chrysotoxum]|uniref:Methyltransferase-like protein 23 n=1 Tax=Dendrobium chrysotoxum TaxID=161865 RepID=A0AAV7FLS2_DENCH|nr:hypothetical protein IEQ34_026675 [Dendrobium chrysotoxum]
MDGAAASTTSPSNSPPPSPPPDPLAKGTMITNMEENYGMFVWPCSIILAEYVWQQRSRFAGKKLVELGAGTSLPGLVAAKVGADVLENMRRICNLNKLDCKILGLTWGEWDAPLFELQPDIILGADVFYDSTDFDDLFATVTFLLQNSQGTVFITTYHNRSGHHLIEFLMAKWGLKCLKLLDGFSFIPAQKASSLQGNIQLVEIALDDRTLLQLIEDEEPRKCKSMACLIIIKIG